jgi:hypothetical protein
MELKSDLKALNGWEKSAEFTYISNSNDLLNTNSYLPAIVLNLDYSRPNGVKIGTQWSTPNREFLPDLSVDYKFKAAGVDVSVGSTLQDVIGIFSNSGLSNSTVYSEIPWHRERISLSKNGLTASIDSGNMHNLNKSIRYNLNYAWKNNDLEFNFNHQEQRLPGGQGQNKNLVSVTTEVAGFDIVATYEHLLDPLLRDMYGRTPSKDNLITTIKKTFEPSDLITDLKLLSNAKLTQTSNYLGVQSELKVAHASGFSMGYRAEYIESLYTSSETYANYQDKIGNVNTTLGFHVLDDSNCALQIFTISGNQNGFTAQVSKMDMGSRVVLTSPNLEGAYGLEKNNMPLKYDLYYQSDVNGKFDLDLHYQFQNGIHIRPSVNRKEIAVSYPVSGFVTQLAYTDFDPSLNNWQLNRINRDMGLQFSVSKRF